MGVLITTLTNGQRFFLSEAHKEKGVFYTFEHCRPIQGKNGMTVIVKEGLNSAGLAFFALAVNKFLEVELLDETSDLPAEDTTADHLGRYVEAAHELWKWAGIQHLMHAPADRDDYNECNREPCKIIRETLGKAK